MFLFKIFLTCLLFFIVLPVYGQSEESIEESLNRISNSYNVKFKVVQFNPNTNNNKYRTDNIIVLRSIEEIESFIRYLNDTYSDYERIHYIIKSSNRLKIYQYFESNDDSHLNYIFTTRGVNFNFDLNSYGKLFIQPTYDFNKKSSSISNFDVDIEGSNSFFSVNLINTSSKDVGFKYKKLVFKVEIKFNFLSTPVINNHVFIGSFFKNLTLTVDSKTGEIINVSN